MIVRALLNGAMQSALDCHRRRNAWRDSGKPQPKSFDETAERRERLQRAYRSRARDEATKYHDKLYLDILQDGCNWHMLQPRHAQMRVPTGVGKSHAARQAVAQQVQAVTQGYVTQAKARGLPHRVLFLVPTHSLGEEARLRLPDGIKTALWQGREATHPVTEEPLCLNLPAVEAAIAVGAEVDRAACRMKREEGLILCPFYQQCGYQRQKYTAKQADVIFAAHEYLTQSAPEEITKNVGLVVVDEAFWQRALTFTELAVDGLAAELGAFPVRDQKTGAIDEQGTALLADLLAKLQRALQATPPGEYLTKAALLTEGFTASNTTFTPASDGFLDFNLQSVATARDLEWRRRVDAPLWPGAPEDALTACKEQYAFLAQLPRRAAMWHAVQELLESDAEASGRLRVQMKTKASGSVRMLHINGRREVSKGLADLPIVVLDATLSPEINKHFLPRAEVAVDLKQVAAPHETVTQVIGLPVGKSALIQLDQGKRRPEEEERVARKRERIVNVAKWRAAGRRVAVITYMGAEQAFIDAGFDTGHFGAIEGIDRWCDVDVLFVVGRPLANGRDLERMAAALTGRPVKLVQHPDLRPGGKPQTSVLQDRPVQLKNGAALTLKCRVFGVPEIDLIRAAITESALIQAVGRARGVNRTEGNAVELFMISHDTATALAIDNVIDFAELEPGAVEEMFQRGMVPQWGADAARLHPDLWPTTQAAKKAYQRAGLDLEHISAGLRGEKRARWGTCSYKYLYKAMSPTSALIQFKPAGNGQRARLVLVDPAKVSDARAQLEATFGKLVSFRMLAGSLWPARSRAGKRRLADIALSPDRNKAWPARKPYVLSPNPRHHETIFARSEHPEPQRRAHGGP